MRDYGGIDYRKVVFMWTYHQARGELIAPGGELVARGYSGHMEGKNNPALEDKKDIGPIPKGFYKITELIPNTEDHGPYVLKLEPDESNTMYGRGGFLIHGDNIWKPGNASKGCIVMARKIREDIWASTDHLLDVTL